jgi:hypothetical protein
MEQKNEKIGGKMKMWKMKKEMLDSMSEKELRAFITGYMMAESKILRAMSSECGCGQICSCGCGQGCDCKDGSCKCDEK